MGETIDLKEWISKNARPKTLEEARRLSHARRVVQHQGLKKALEELKRKFLKNGSEAD